MSLGTFANQNFKELRMEKIQWKVEGMHCANCALTINKYLQNKGARNVSVNAIDGDVSFEVAEAGKPRELAKAIKRARYLALLPYVVK